jgi:hypothetical protein
MVNRPKIVGTDAENRVRDYARSRGWVHADRLTLSGINDRGDIRLGDGVEFTIEVKGGQGATSGVHSHLKELRAEMANNEHRFGAVIAKKPGSTKVGEDWVAILPVDVLFDILQELADFDVI